MYPNLYYAFRDLFGVDWPALRIVNSFGFFVAIAFIISATVLSLELRRKSKQGLFIPTETEIMVGSPASFGELAINFLIGFIMGYKILAIFFLDRSATEDPQAYIFSDRGSWPLGLLIGAFFAGLKWWEKNKQKLPKPEKRKIRIWPQDRVGEITILALIFGLLGAKLFDIFENWSDFLKRPKDYIFSPAGLTIYGGLICASLAIWWYAKKNKISFWNLNDAAAPALMLGYAVGRIGCQVAGDGDWGIFNSAYQVSNTGQITPAEAGRFQQTIQEHSQYFYNNFENMANVPSASFSKPGFLSFLPDWMFAWDFPHNVNEAGVSLASCTEKYCNHLPAPVFPTPFYETVLCLLLFAVLWFTRKRFKIPGTLFAFYLILNGTERFFIEKIRVNVKFKFFGFHPTQAEVISSLLVLTGTILLIYLLRKGKSAIPNTPVS